MRCYWCPRQGVYAALIYPKNLRAIGRMRRRGTDGCHWATNKRGEKIVACSSHIKQLERQTSGHFSELPGRAVH